jgi:hypothetical protein
MNDWRTTETRVLDEALHALETQTRGKVKRLKREHDPADFGFDAIVDFQIHGRNILIVIEVKNVDRRAALAQIKAQLDAAVDRHLPGYLPMLAAPYITEAMAEECRRIDLLFVDTAGNLFVRTPDTLFFILGRPRPEHLGHGAYQTMTPTGMRVILPSCVSPNLPMPHIDRSGEWPKLHSEP